MPTVEKATPRRVAVAGLPGVQLQGAETAESAGAGALRAQAGTRQAVAQLGQATADVGVGLYARQQAERRRQEEEAKTRADQVAVMAGQNQMQAWRRTRLHDPDNGALAKQGLAAQGEPELVDQDFEKQAGEVMKRMVTPEQQVAFERWLVSERDSVNLAVLDHARREQQVYEANELKNNLTNAVDLAIKENMTDIRQGAVKIADAEANLRKLGPKLGLSPAEIDAQARALRTQAIEGTVNGMIARGRVQDARAYFNDVEGAIDQNRVKPIRDSLKAGATKKEAQVQTERILGMAGTYDQQRAEAKKIADADVQDEVLQRIEHEHAVKEQQTREGKRDLLRGIADKLDKTRSMSSITPAEMASLDPDERSAFRNYVKQLIDFGDVKVGRGTWYSHIMNAQKDPLKWAQEVNLEKDIDKMSRADFTDVVNLRGQILAGQAKKAESLMDGFLTNLGVVNEQLGSAGIDPNAKVGTPEYKMKVDLLSEIDREVQRRQVAKGGKLSNDEIRAVADSLLIDTVIQKGTGRYRDILTSKPYYDVTAKKGVALAAIPPDKRAQIHEALRKRNREPSPDNVLEYWREYQATQSGGQ